jgi:hypothetical protein
VNEFLAGVLAVTTLASVLSSALLGLLVGAFYGWELSNVAPPVFPRQLFVVGLLSVAVLAVLSYFEATELALDHSVGRALLWAFTCGSIPIGRYARLRWEVWWLRHRRRRIDQ